MRIHEEVKETPSGPHRPPPAVYVLHFDLEFFYTKSKKKPDNIRIAVEGDDVCRGTPFNMLKNMIN